jgi:signal peptide peptidase SppA
VNVEHRPHRPLVRVAGQILNRPVAVTEMWAATIIAAVRSELNINLLTTTEGVTLDTVGMDAMALHGRQMVDRRRAKREERKIFPEASGVAIIEVSGTLTKNWGIDSYSGFTGYDGIKAKLIAAMDDDSIDAIMLDIDSPGGAVAGCFDLVDLIYACNKKNGGKLIAAVANEQACSAAYAIMSAADPGWRFVPRTGEVGSIGVLLLHADVQKAMELEGVKVTIFRAGKWKAEGNPYEDIAKETAERIQGTLDDMRDIFVDTVARNLAVRKSDVAGLKKSVRETEALTYIGEHAREQGLVEAVASEDQAWDRLMERLGR